MNQGNVATRIRGMFVCKRNVVSWVRRTWTALNNFRLIADLRSLKCPLRYESCQLTSFQLFVVDWTHNCFRSDSKIFNTHARRMQRSDHFSHERKVTNVDQNRTVDRFRYTLPENWRIAFKMKFVRTKSYRSIETLPISKRTETLDWDESWLLSARMEKSTEC